MAKIIKICLIFLIMTAWIFSGWPQIWKNPSFPPKIQEAKATEYLTNESFTGSISDWTVEYTKQDDNSIIEYDASVYEDTPGSVKGRAADVDGKRAVLKGWVKQTTASIDSSDTVTLKLYWKKDVVPNGTAQLTHVISVDIYKPSAVWVTIWSDATEPTTETAWTYVEQDVSSYFDETGTYDFRFYYNMKSAAVNGAEALAYFDNTSLDVTPPAATTTIGDGTNPGNSTVAPGTAITDLDAVTFVTDTGTDSVTAATVTLAAGTAAGLSEIRITSDDGSILYFSAVANPASDTVNFSGGTAIPVTTSSVQFKVRITPKTHANMPAPQGSEYAVTGTITSFTSTNSQLGSDSGSATITVDNLSPGNTTSNSGSAGDTEVTINYTTPADTDLNSVVVLRDTSTVTDNPVEGATYSVGNTIGTATVACVDTTVSPSTADSCTDTDVVNDIAYYYEIFAKDDNGNYATGVIPAGSPFTPTGAAVPTLTFTIDGDLTIGFGTLVVANARFATDTTGSDTATSAHTMTVATNASSGYTVTYNGATLTASGGTINVAEFSGVDGTPGTEQFAISIATDGDATIVTEYQYTGPNYKFEAGATTPIITENGPTDTEIFSVYYLANISSLTEAGSYSTSITYIATGNF